MSLESLLKISARSVQLCSLLVLSAALFASCREQSRVEQINGPSRQVIVKKNPWPSPMPSVVIGKPYAGRGIVKFINQKEGWVEIDHEDIEGLMPAMEMEWFVKNRSLLQSLNVGDKVEFVVVETGKVEIITEMKTIKQF